MIIGIFAGLGTAVSQSVSYQFSRFFIQRHGNSFQLLVVSHMIMGIFAAAALTILLPRAALPPLRVYLLPLLLCNGYYLFGQMAFFTALKRSEASRVAPLLGLKIVFLAMFSILFYGTSFALQQWAALALCITGAVFSNWSGGTLPWRSLCWIMLACMGYSLSDINIKILITKIGDPNIMFSSTLAGLLSYTLIGIPAAIVFGVYPGMSKRLILPALPFSFFWFIGMLLLFYCFAVIGPVFGNIVQSTRGIFSVIVGTLIAALGFHSLESRLLPKIIIRRIIAAALITLAIVLFSTN